MPHEIETMAYTNEVPWHGLGQHVESAPTVDEMIKLAKLDWQVEKWPLIAIQPEGVGDASVDFDRNHALVRNTDHAVMGICGPQYTPIQNHQAFEFFDEFVRAGDATMETAGSIKGGKYVWGLANLNSSFQVTSGDEVKGYLLAMIPHVPGNSLIFKFTSVRVVCNNTLSLSLKLRGLEHRISHRYEWSEEACENAKDALGIARNKMSDFEKNAKVLQSLNLTRDEAVRVLAPTYQGSTDVKDIVTKFEKVANRPMKRLMDVYEKAPGATPGNGWGILNAVTYFSDHLASNTADNRWESATIGRTSKRKVEVLQRLLEMS